MQLLIHRESVDVETFLPWDLGWKEMKRESDFLMADVALMYIFIALRTSRVCHLLSNSLVGWGQKEGRTMSCVE